MDCTTAADLAYLGFSFAFTIWVARTLYKNGRVFLIDTFRHEALADSVNHLLVVGFCLINFGYVCVRIGETGELYTARQAVESVANRVGWVLLMLGGMHFFNLYIFNRMRRRALAPQPQPPHVVGVPRAQVIAP